MILLSPIVSSLKTQMHCEFLRRRPSRRTMHGLRYSLSRCWRAILVPFIVLLGRESQQIVNIVLIVRIRHGAIHLSFIIDVSRWEHLFCLKVILNLSCLRLVIDFIRMRRQWVHVSRKAVKLFSASGLQSSCLDIYLNLILFNKK